MFITDHHAVVRLSRISSCIEKLQRWHRNPDRLVGRRGGYRLYRFAKDLLLLLKRVSCRDSKDLAVAELMALS